MAYSSIAHRRLARSWRLKRWIICRLSFKNMWRPVWTPGRWTELFFLDEATALAAGHRPCMYCRRADALRFRQAWTEAHGAVRSLVELDEILHEARGRRWVANLTELPAGTLVESDGAAWLWQAGLLWRWSFAGYGESRPARGRVTVLTPEPVVGVLRNGYAPEIRAAAESNVPAGPPSRSGRQSAATAARRRRT